MEDYFFLFANDLYWIVRASDIIYIHENLISVCPFKLAERLMRLGVLVFIHIHYSSELHLFLHAFTVLFIGSLK